MALRIPNSCYDLGYLITKPPPPGVDAVVRDQRMRKASVVALSNMNARPLAQPLSHALRHVSKIFWAAVQAVHKHV